MTRLIFSLSLVLAMTTCAWAQTTSTPSEDFGFRSTGEVMGNTTWVSTPQPGFVVTKSGQRYEGSLKINMTGDELKRFVVDMGEEKEKFKAKEIDTYGLSMAVGPENESPEEWYYYDYKGSLNGQELETSAEMPGYVVMKDGTRLEGLLTIKRRSGNPHSFELVQGDDKVKGETMELKSFGLSITEEEAKVYYYISEAKDFEPGFVMNKEGQKRMGEVALVTIPGRFYHEAVVFRDGTGPGEVFMPVDLHLAHQTGKGASYTGVDSAVVEMEYAGENVWLYRNPHSTTVNPTATALAKQAVQTGSVVAAGAIVRDSDSKYEIDSDLDKRISQADLPELYSILDSLVDASGYPSEQALLDSEDNPFKAPAIAAVVAIAGKEVASSDDLTVYYKEYIYYIPANSKSFMVYRPAFEELMRPLLQSCNGWATLDEGDQKDLLKWKNRAEAAAFLDACF